MRKQVYGRKFKRDKNERKALFSGLISSMVLRGRITTTEQKAKAIKGDLEKLVTKARKGESARRSLQKDLKPLEIDKMINDIAPRFANRPGGYTRIVRTGKRFNDNASMVILEWVEGPLAVTKEKPAKKAAKTKAVSKPAKKSSISGKTAKGKKSSVAKAKEDK